MALWRTLKRKFGIAGQRVAVRPHLAWYWRWLGIAVAGVLMAGIGWATYDFGMTFAGFRRVESERELARLTETVARQQQEIGELRSQVAQAERQLQMERATYGDVTKQVRALSEVLDVLRRLDDVHFLAVEPTDVTHEELAREGVKTPAPRVPEPDRPQLCSGARDAHVWVAGRDQRGRP